MPPVRVATTGHPERIASRRVTDRPSRTDVSANTSAASIRSATSSRSPRNPTRGVRPASSTCCSSSARRAPSPTSSRRAPLIRRAKRSNASMSTCCACCGFKLPTASTRRSVSSRPSSARVAPRGRTASGAETPFITVTNRSPAHGSRTACEMRTASHTHTTRRVTRVASDSSHGWNGA